MVTVTLLVTVVTALVLVHWSPGVNTEFRTMDGRKNNKDNTNWGAKDTNQVRWKVAGESINTYADGKSTPRTMSTDKLSFLPSPRTVSLRIHKTVHPTEDRKITHMVAAFGQFLDHDITSTRQSNMDCCSKEQNSINCPQINVSEDKFYKKFSKRCLPFKKSARRRGENGVFEQINDITSFIDGSNVYGSDDEKAAKLRDTKGLLKTSNTNENRNSKEVDNLPTRVEKEGNNCGGPKAGDFRAEVQPVLTSLHTLFMLEHNRIAKAIWRKYQDDEEVYQRARRLVVAQLQNIVYNEFLPVVLGKNEMDKRKITLPQHGQTEYNHNTNPSIINEFSTAAFRFGHSLVSGKVKPACLTRFVHDCPAKKLSDVFFENSRKFVTGHDGWYFREQLIGAIEQNSMQVDTALTRQLTNFLFKKTPSNVECPKDRRPKDISGWGQDLAAINILRGRDHGIATWNQARQYCKLKTVNFVQKASEFGIVESTYEKLKEVYAYADDVDLWTGGLSEKPVEDGLVGPTFACIIGEQFKRLLDGDRFFFTHDCGPNEWDPQGLEPELRDVIRKRRLSDIMCDNLYGEGKPNDGPYPQRFVMRPMNDKWIKYNPRLDCNSDWEHTPLTCDSTQQC